MASLGQFRGRCARAARVLVGLTSAKGIKYIVSMETLSKTALLDPWYVTGFVDGEGSFTYSRAGRNVLPFFAIKLTVEDVGILESIQEFFDGIGKIYHILPRP